MVETGLLSDPSNEVYWLLMDDKDGNDGSGDDGSGDDGSGDDER